MKTKRFISHKERHIEVEEFELGTLPDNGILVENHYSVVSIGTELYNWIHGGEPHIEKKFPRTTGYSSAGIVIDTGKNVKDIKNGDIIAHTAYHASHSIVNKKYYPVPAGISTKHAAFLTMAGISARGNRIAKIELGEAVVITGLGLIGQFALSLVKLSGAMPVIAIDPDDFRLQIAKKRGADIIINPSKIDNLAEEISAYCYENGANVIIEATGLPQVYPMAVKLACIRGRFIALGSPRGSVNFNFFEDVHLREVSMLGAFNPITPENENIHFRFTRKRERELILKLMKENKLGIDDLITHEHKPDECQKVYDHLADKPRETLGVIFKWQD